MIVRELFQVEFPPDMGDDPKVGDTLKSDASARKAKPPNSQRVTPEGVSGRVMNRLPVDEHQWLESGASGPHDFKFAMSGQSDASRDWNQEAVRNGYKRLPMKPTDAVPFEPYADVGGFAERRNLMDRK